jgi:hypothetical protein
MTPQEIFNTAYLGVLSQGGPSKAGNMCKYRGPNGRKCGVGWLIDDDTAAKWDKAELPAFDDIAAADPDWLAPWMHKNAKLITAIQGAHDSPDADVDFLGDFTRIMAIIAAQHNLTVPA